MVVSCLRRAGRFLALAAPAGEPNRDARIKGEIHESRGKLVVLGEALRVCELIYSPEQIENEGVEQRANRVPHCRSVVIQREAGVIHTGIGKGRNSLGRAERSGKRMATYREPLFRSRAEI